MLVRADIIRAATRLPFQIHAKHLILVGLTIVVMFTASFGLYPLSTRKYVDRDMNALDVAKVVVLGNSQLRHLQMGDAYLAYPTVNATLSGTGYVVRKAIFESILPYLTNTRLAIIQFDNFSFYRPVWSARNGDYRDVVASGVPWYKLPSLNWFDKLAFEFSYNDVMRPLLVGPKLSLPVDEIKSKIWHRFTAREKKPAPKKPTNPARDGRSFKNIIDGRLKAFEEKDEDVYQANKAAFLEILDMCARNDIDVILVRPPLHNSYAQILQDKPKLQSELDALLAEARKHHNAIALWNFAVPDLFAQERYLDPFHLDDEGFAELARSFSEHLRNWETNHDEAMIWPQSSISVLPSSDLSDSRHWQIRNGKASIRQTRSDANEDVFEVTLSPGALIEQLDELSVTPKQTAEARARFWRKAGDESAKNLEFVVGRQGQGDWVGATTRLKLTTDPQEYSVKYEFDAYYTCAKVQLTNRGSSPATFCISGMQMFRSGDPQF